MLFMYFLLCYFGSSFIIFVYIANPSILNYFSNLQIYWFFFFFLCNYLKADDTYIQLKKDLEYLDLKVRL